MASRVQLNQLFMTAELLQWAAVTVLLLCVDLSAAFDIINRLELLDKN